MESTNGYTETDLGNVSPNPCGVYNDTRSYEYLDLVEYDGGSYLCIAEFGMKVTGKAPTAGKTTENWQVITIPGKLTPEYIAIHDDVVNKSKQVETNRAAVELSQQEIEAAQADVQQMRKDTQDAAELARDSKESAAGYAQSAEASRKAAEVAEQNTTAQIQGFDDHVEEKKTEADQSIESARQDAVDVVAAKGENVVNDLESIRKSTANYVDEAKKYADNAGASATASEKFAGNAESSAKEAETILEDAKNVQKEINDTVNSFDSDTAKALEDLSNAKNESIKAIESAGNEQKSTVTEEGEKQIKAIQTLKEDIDTVANSISEDKKSVENTKDAVDKLKTQIDTNSEKALQDIGTAKDDAVKEVQATIGVIGLYIDEDGDLCQKEEE